MAEAYEQLKKAVILTEEDMEDISKWTSPARKYLLYLYSLPVVYAVLEILT